MCELFAGLIVGNLGQLTQLTALSDEAEGCGKMLPCSSMFIICLRSCRFEGAAVQPLLSSKLHQEALQMGGLAMLRACDSGALRDSKGSNLRQCQTLKVARDPKLP